MVKARALLLLLLFLPLFQTAAASVVHGTIYEWSSLEPLSGVIVEVNSTPKQRFVAKNAEYSFSLPVGTYQIQAMYYVDETLVYYSEENITVFEEGDFVLDLIMLPVIGEGLPFDYGGEMPEFDEDIFGEGDFPSFAVAAAASVVGVFAAALLFFTLKQRRRRGAPKMQEEMRREKAAEERRWELEGRQGLPSDLRLVLSIIEKEGGRITQKNLRKKLPYSEAKVSLMLADLEDRGLIRKIKVGRGNIIVLKNYRKK